MTVPAPVEITALLKHKPVNESGNPWNGHATGRMKNEVIEKLILSKPTEAFKIMVSFTHNTCLFGKKYSMRQAMLTRKFSPRQIACLALTIDKDFGDSVPRE